MPTAKRDRQRQGREARREAIRAAQRRAARKRQIIAAVVAVAVVFGIGLFISRGGGGGGDGASTTTTTLATPPRAPPVAAGQTITGDTPCPAAGGSSPRASSFEKAPPLCITPGRSYTATFQTTEGNIDVALDTTTTPGTANNFVVLARYHYYDGTAIHRTDPSIEIIQGGSPSTQSADDPGPGYTITDEGSPPRSYREGDLVMARTGAPNSAGAQFFFVAGPAAGALDAQGTYVTFGRVTAGLDVVKAVLGLHQADASTNLGGAPREVVLVERVTIGER
ncbi:MAG: peptidylprolyl isomerase [Acidimicrobiales bacterium]